MDFLRFFSLIDTEAKMSLKAEASKFILSYLWWFIEPLLWISIFYFVFEILLDSGRPDYVLFLFCGKIPFQWFSKSVTAGSNSIIINKGLIGQIDMPKALFPYSAVQEALYKQWVDFLLLFGALVLSHHWPQSHWLWIVPLLVVQYGMILVCAMIGSLFVSFVQDFRIVINMFMLFLMFASGVFWDISSIPDITKRSYLLIFNPIAFLLDGYRKVFMHNTLYNLHHLLYLGVLVFIALVAMHFIMNKTDKIITAKVVNS